MQINKASERTIRRSVEEANLISRRIILGGGIPIVPSIWYLGYSKDPRIRHTKDWWVKQISGAFMESCDVLCTKPNLVGVATDIIDLEKALWKKLCFGKPEITSDAILDFLLNYNVKGILDGTR